MPNTKPNIGNPSEAVRTVPPAVRRAVLPLVAAAAPCWS